MSNPNTNRGAVLLAELKALVDSFPQHQRKDLIKITLKDEGENNKHLYFDAVKAEKEETPQLAKATSDAT